MQFDSFSDFLAMGGYGFYVWISFGLSFLALGLLLGWGYWHKHHLVNVAREEIQRTERIKAARKNTASSNDMGETQ